MRHRSDRVRVVDADREVEGAVERDTDGNTVEVFGVMEGHLEPLGFQISLLADPGKELFSGQGEVVVGVPGALGETADGTGE